jgi:TonB family protein
MMIALILAVAAAPSLPKFLKPPLGPSDYPPSALRNGEQGVELTSLLISPTGVVEKCDIVVPSKYHDLDDAACARLMKAEVAPAKDQNGIPVYGLIKKWNTWSIGGPVDQPVSADVTLTVNHLPPGLPVTPVSKLTLVVDSSGSVEECGISTSSGNLALDTAACSAGVAAAKIEAIKNAKGEAVRAVIPLGVAFSTATPEAKP